MAAPRVLVLRAPGTNCDRETAFAFEQAGGRAELVHINRLLENPRVPQDFQILCVPGGFSYGDDISAGRILANQIRHHLREACEEFRQAQKLILGICNGFQVLIKTGILLEDDARGPLATLTWNQRGRYEDRWVQLSVSSERSVFLRGMQSLYVPVAHAEGQFVARDSATLAQLDQRGQLALRYAGTRTNEQGQVLFPENPNGSQANVAGICDATGRVLGLMPHPERHIDPTHHPRWTRGEGQPQGAGLALFQNAIRYFSD